MRAIGRVQVLVVKKNAFESLNFFDRLLRKPHFLSVCLDQGYENTFIYQILMYVF